MCGIALNTGRDEDIKSKTSGWGQKMTEFNVEGETYRVIPVIKGGSERLFQTRKVFFRNGEETEEHGSESRISRKAEKERVGEEACVGGIPRLHNALGIIHDQVLCVTNTSSYAASRG
jgi:hypothetical protein